MYWRRLVHASTISGLISLSDTNSLKIGSKYSNRCVYPVQRVCWQRLHEPTMKINEFIYTTKSDAPKSSTKVLIEKDSTKHNRRKSLRCSALTVGDAIHVDSIRRTIHKPMLMKWTIRKIPMASALKPNGPLNWHHYAVRQSINQSILHRCHHTQLARRISPDFRAVKSNVWHLSDHKPNLNTINICI